MIVLLTKLLSIAFMVKSSPAPLLSGVNGNAGTALHASSNGSSDSAVRVGFLGCGTIASAIATGLATQANMTIASIAVTKRSESKSSALLEDFPSLVSVHEDNQEILDKSDIIFVCLLPQQTSEALQALSFDESRHELISLVVSISRPIHAGATTNVVTRHSYISSPTCLYFTSITLVHSQTRRPC
jgi:pyrroline-5-carboxylate reductase